MPWHVIQHLQAGPAVIFALQNPADNLLVTPNEQTHQTGCGDDETKV